MKNRSVILSIAAILIAAIVIGAAFYFDNAARDFVAQRQERALKSFMRNVSLFGDWYEHFALGVILAAIAWWRSSEKWLRIFLAMLIALAIAGVVARGIKIATARARPSVKAEEVANRWNSKYHAFPSGHVAASMGFFGVLLLANRRIGAPCLTIPVLIGVSRMYVSAHYLSDVVCAAILGMLCAFFVFELVLPKIENLKWLGGRGGIASDAGSGT